MVRIFGGNMFEDESQARGFADMLGLGEHKPFECVGEVDECVAALSLLAAMPEWSNDLLVRRFAADVLPRVEDPAALVDEALRPDVGDSFPERFRTMLPAVPSPGR